MRAGQHCPPGGGARDGGNHPRGVRSSRPRRLAALVITASLSLPRARPGRRRPARTATKGPLALRARWRPGAGPIDPVPAPRPLTGEAGGRRAGAPAHFPAGATRKAGGRRGSDWARGPRARNNGGADRGAGAGEGGRDPGTHRGRGELRFPRVPSPPGSPRRGAPSPRRCHVPSGPTCAPPTCARPSPGSPAADSGQSTRRTGSGLRAAPQPLPRGRGRGLAAQPRGDGGGDLGPRSEIRAPPTPAHPHFEGRTDPKHPGIVHDRPSLLLGWGN